MSSLQRPHHSPETGTVRVIAIVGPTAVGKTDVAEEVAQRLGGEIVSADSMQVYRGMDIGTAKPATDKRRVPYHCLDIAEPGEAFSAALFQKCARESIADISMRSQLPLLVGGTGLYVRAALDDMRFPSGEQSDNELRVRYESIAEESGAEALHAELSRRDTASAALIHPNNVRRVVRALEMLDGGISYATQHAGLRERRSIYDTRFFGLTMERSQLYRRIDQRVDEMVARGLLEEVRTLLDAGLRDALTAAQAIGYKELVPVIEQSASLDDAVESIKQSTRRYAKRQLTWFRADPRVRWLDVTERSSSDTAELLVARLDWEHDPT